MKNIKYYLLADDSEYYRWSATEQEVKILLFVKFGVPFIVTKVVAFVSVCIAGAIIAYDYTKLPVTLGSFHLTLINPIKVVQGACLLTKYLLWDRRILLWYARQSGPNTIGFRPVHVLIYLSAMIYLNWHWNAFGEIDAGFARGNQPDHIYYRRFRKQRIRQPDQEKDPILDKWVPGSLGTPFKWEYLRSLRMFIWFIGTWW